MATARREFNAPAPVSAEVPAYRVLEYDGPPIVKTYCRFDEKSRTIVKEDREITGGYLVVFPKGHSNYYESLDALEAAGLGDIVPVIRMADDAEVGKDIPEKTTQRVIEKASRGG